MTTFSAVFVGAGPLLVQCAERWIARGHHIAGVASDCADVRGWAARTGIACTPPTADAASVAGGASFEFLFSVVNHRIMPEALIRRATRAAINYHNSLLPALAGFNAPAWAILDGRDTHGITWHGMLPEVDAGGIFLQVPLTVAAADTAFTLEAQCAAAAAGAFDELVANLEGDALAERPQEGARTFHAMFERPAGAALLDWGAGAAHADRLLRALAYGPQDNPLGLPKLWDGAAPLWIGEGALGGVTDAGTGTVLAVEDGVAVVAVDGRQLRLAGLRDARGAALDTAGLHARGVQRGRMLPAPPQALLDEVTALDARVRRGERVWVRRLDARTAPTLGAWLPSHASGGAADACDVPLSPVASAALGAQPEGERTVTWMTALALLVAHLGGHVGGDAFDLDVDLGVVPAPLADFFASRVPLRLAVAPDQSLAGLLAAVRDELVVLKRYGTYARDVVARHITLRPRAEAGELAPLPVALVAEGCATDGAALGVRLTGAGENAEVVLASGDAHAASALAARLARLVEAVLTEPTLTVADAPVITAGERALLLNDWNATDASFRDDACVHELFAEQAARTPDQVAVTFGDDALTYAALDRRADAVAARLRALGVGPDALVAICVERSLDMVVGLLGILKAGAAYVPLDPAYPRERLTMMLEDSRARVLLTQRHLDGRAGAGDASVLHVESCEPSDAVAALPPSGVTPAHLAYVIFTSGSTGRPKGVMVTHRNVANFFTAMDRVIGPESGVWLAVTSISFDISVLELFWTLCRGFEVVVHPESDRASVGRQAVLRSGRPERMGFGLFYFAADATKATDAYRLLLDGARFADANGFDAVWTPERHFHAFGGLYPNAAVTSAALATITSRIQIRAGSVVLPLHDPIRVAEEWSVVDNLSGGRVGLSFASGWHADDFAFKPENYARRREVMAEHIRTVLTLWRGGSVPVTNGEGRTIDVRILPRPVQQEPPIWLASAGSVDTFRAAGTMGVNVLTNMLGQRLEDLRGKLAAYREARAAAGHAGSGTVSVMLHTFIGPDTEEVRRLVREPFTRYLATSIDLVKMAPFAFPAFRAPSGVGAADLALDAGSIAPEDLKALLDHAFDRYFDTAGLFGTPEKALAMVDALKAIGVNEVACLIDFGVDADVTLAHLPYLAQLMRASQDDGAEAPSAPTYSVAEQLARRDVTHLQCTPSKARMLSADPDVLSGLARLDCLLLGGEALPTELADQLAGVVRGRVLNMYGPTETTVWSTCSDVRAGEPVSIGRPIANTVVRILDADRRLVPVGVTGELYIGGAGVTRGYLHRPDLTGERFVADPYASGARLYRTGDLARYAPDGTINFLGRTDQQVKVSGYRIELGEIEGVLARHPGVRQAVVNAELHAAAGTQLVAYVVARPPGKEASAAAAAETVDQWRTLWDGAYAPRAAVDARFDTSGWTRSDTGEPISPEVMREWRDHTVERLRSLGARRVLEIGCGTGMLLYGLLPHVEHYTAVDVAPQALARIRDELRAEERARVTLVQAAADAVDAVDASAAPYDLVIINSVAQYFPGANYLRRMLEHAVARVRDGGHVWVGDVRSLALLEAFHTSVELARASDDTPVTELRARVDRRVADEGELAVDPGFFHALRGVIPRLASVRTRLKRGRDQNEMTRFRYDVVIDVGAVTSAVWAVPTHAAPVDMEGVRALLDDGAPVVRVTDLPNARVRGVLAACRALPTGVGTSGELRMRVTAEDTGVDPEALAALHPDYEVDALFARSGVSDRFDAVFRHRTRGPALPLADDVLAADGAGVGPTRATTNSPVRSARGGADVVEWRRYLRERLPEYMVPSMFVTLDALPLTPNGKIDRRSLRVPEAVASVPATLGAGDARQASATDLEEQISGVWCGLLGVAHVPVEGNIFDIGANSLLAVQASRLITELLGRNVPLVKLFQYPTVRLLAAHLGSSEAGAEAEVGEEGRDRAGRRLDAMQRRRSPRARRVLE